MRKRRPHLFSDSTTTTERTVTRDVFSYHLETLTSQKDEGKFEDFARGLAEKFISPNLRPQTGPLGGGDGKTDSETYPVAAEVASRWYVPDLTGLTSVGHSHSVQRKTGAARLGLTLPTSPERVASISLHVIC
jgi:hypothetical protein